MRHPDYDKAFHDTPDYVRSAIELGMRKDEKKMKRRQKFMSALAVAAAFIVILGAAALGASRLAAPRPDNRVASRPRATATAEGTGAAAALVTPEDTVLFTCTPEPEITPNPTPLPEVTPEPTPLPTAAAEAEIEAAEAGEVEVEEAGEVEVEEAFEYAYLGLSPEDAVYCAPGDSRFHFNANCPELEGQITVVTTLGAAMRDHTVCEECKPMEAAVVFTQEEGVMRSAATGDILVYYNPNGTYFHVNSDCSGMRGAQLHTLREAVEAGKYHCPVCIGDKEESYWLDVPEADADPVYTSPYSGYYHRSGDCLHLPSMAVETYGAVRADGALAPCPHCLPELAGADGGYARNADAEEMPGVIEGG